MADYDRRGDRDRDRDRRDRDRDRDRDRRKSRSRSRERSSRRSDSRSRSPPRGGRRRKTLFDVLPSGVAAAPGAPAAPVVAAPLPVPVAPAAPVGFSSGFGGIPGMPPAPMGIPGMPNMMMGLNPPSQQATRHARRVYVGGLPPTANEQSVATFFSHALAAIGGNTAGPGNAVVNVYINREKNFSFVEFRTVEECSNAMALDGIMFEGVSVRVRRPNDYNPAAAAGLGPSAPNPNLNLAAIGLGGGGGLGGGMVSSSGNSDPAERIFVGGLPHYLTEEQCRELLQSFGAIKSFDLVKDRDTGGSKGYGFVVYMDPSVTDVACAGLNGLKMGDRTLTVRRATEQGAGGAGGPAMPMPVGGITLNPALALAGLSGIPGVGINLPGPPPLPTGTRIVVLDQAVTVEELVVEDEYKEIVEDMRDECGKYGQVLNLYIPRPTAENPHPPGAGKVIIEYPDVAAAARARQAMHGRKFGGRVVVATSMEEGAYAAGHYDS